MVNQREIRIKVSHDKITFIRDNNSKDSDFKKDAFKLELSVARIFHRVLNAYRLSRDIIFEKTDYEILGKSLFKMLIDYDEAKSFLFPVIADVLRNPDQRCRIYLEFSSSADDLATLPWEYLLLENENPKIEPTFLAADEKSKFDLIRSINSIDSSFKPVANQKLTVIIVTANCTAEQSLKISLDKMEKWRVKLSRDFSDSLEILTIQQPSKFRFAEDLENLMNNIDGPCVLHFFGHARVEDRVGQLLFIENEESADWIDDKSFADYFSNVNHSLPHVIVLQACSSGRVTCYDGQQMRGVGLNLAMQKIPAVVAMQNDVTEEDSFAFLNVLYRSLLSGDDIANAVTKGRTYLGCTYKNNPNAKNYSNNIFGTPVLFLSTSEPISLMIKKTEIEIPQSNRKRCTKCGKQWINFSGNKCQVMACGGILESVSGESASSEPSLIDKSRPDASAAI
ncbi:MAG: CHAT domain-containing protein [Saprospiraceae bacterium]